MSKFRDPEVLYRSLGRLLETMPSFEVSRELTIDHHKWLGLGDALMSETGDIRDQVEWRTAVSMLNRSSWITAVENIKAILFRTLAKAELAAPMGVGGAFIPVGNSFDAFAALSKLLQSADKDVLVVDPYMDESALTDFGTVIPEGVSVRILADQHFHKPSLVTATHKWIAQYGTSRPLEVRLAPPKSLHDRAIFIDHLSAWTLTQSLKDFAKRSPAEIIRADDTAVLKIDAYEAIWAVAVTTA